MAARGRGTVAQANREIQELRQRLEELTQTVMRQQQAPLEEMMRQQQAPQGEEEEEQGRQSIRGSDSAGSASDEGEAGSDRAARRPRRGQATVEERWLKVMEGQLDGIKVDVPEYGGSLRSEELIDWLNRIEKFFDWKEMDDERRIKFASTRLKEHAAIWWDHLQKERVRRGQHRIHTWERMVRELKAKFLPEDYDQVLFRKFQNLRQKEVSVQEYTDEFYRLSIRVEHEESEKQKAARYVNGLKYVIQDELSMLKLNTVEEAYQFALRAEEKLSRGSARKAFAGKTAIRNQTDGRNGPRYGQGETSAGTGKQTSMRGSSGWRGNMNRNQMQRGNGGYPRGQRNGAPQGMTRGRGYRPPLVCFRCGGEGHRAYECSQFVDQTRQPRE